MKMKMVLGLLRGCDLAKRKSFFEKKRAKVLT